MRDDIIAEHNGLADEKTDVQVLFFGHRRLRFCVHGRQEIVA
jgi:hypothetical protein